MNIFEINSSFDIDVEEFMDSKIYTISNFYRYPDKVINYIIQGKHHFGKVVKIKEII